MKKFISYLISLIAAVSVIWSCSQIEEPGDILDSSVEVSFSASTEERESSSKTFIKDTYSVWWNVGDRISVFTGSGLNGGYLFESQNVDEAAIATFTGSTNGLAPGDSYWAVYPYSTANSCDGNSITTVVPNVQVAIAGTFPECGFPSMAVTQNNELQFYNICGGFKITLNRHNIKSILIRTLNGEALAGTVQAAFGSEGKPVIQNISNPSSEVTLVAPDGGCFEADVPYFVVLIPGDINGFELQFEATGSGAPYQNANTNTIKRSVFVNLNHIDGYPVDWYYDVPEAVDLGLSVKWAPFNFGASAPEEAGDYYAWGDIVSKPKYNWDTYRWCAGTANSLLKYSGDEYYGVVDNKLELDAEDDVVKVNWKGNWRMPMRSEFKELLDQCDWQWDSLNGVPGYYVKSRKNSNQIFLPAAGLRANTQAFYAGEYGLYWSSTSYLSDYSCGLYFDSEERTEDIAKRAYGYTIRPVLGAEYVPVESVTIDREFICVGVGNTSQLVATVHPDNATYQDVSWKSLNNAVATVTQEDGLVRGFEAMQTRVVAYSADGAKTDTCIVSILKVPEAVDMGLSVKWASFNMGALEYWHVGDFFAWGETAPKGQFDWSTYLWGSGEKSLTKYNSFSYAGKADATIMLESADDAATVAFGNEWRMPTGWEWLELYYGCDWTWAVENGIPGFMVKSKTNDNSIFLPACGVITDSDGFIDLLKNGYYWSSTLNTGWENYEYSDEETPGYAFSFDFNQSGFMPYCGVRCYGRNIRPVHN